MSGGYFPTAREYTVGYGLTRDRLARLTDANPEIVICHPGPMNRGLEISADAADAAQSLVLDQVSAGVAVRMSVLYHLLAGADTPTVRGAAARGERGMSEPPHHAGPALLGRRGHRRPRPRRHDRRDRHRPRRALGRASASTPTGSSCCPASSTSTPTCASPAARTPRRSPPARPPPRPAGSPPSSPWPTPARSPTPPRPPSGSSTSVAPPGSSTSSPSAP